MSTCLALRVAATVFAIASTGWSQVTERISVTTTGAESNADCDSSVARTLSDDGRFVLFRSSADNLVPGDTNLRLDVFLRDRLTGTTERVSADVAGVQGNGHSGLYGIALSPDGRYVLFESAATNLVAGDTNGAREVFLCDRMLGTIERVALDSSGVQANGESFYPSISANGRFVCFTSGASNLVAGDTNGKWDVFVRDRWNGTTELVSYATGGVQGNNDSYKAEISADGQVVAFESSASNLVLNDSNLSGDVFAHDRATGTTTIISAALNGAPGNDLAYNASVSADGHFVAFSSTATNLVSGDANGLIDAFVRDRLAGTTELISVSTAGVQSNTGTGPTGVSADGRFVVFSGFASNLVAGDTNGRADTFLRDRRARTTERISLSTGGAEGDDSTWSGSITSGGRFVVLLSHATNLVSGDTNGYLDVFIHDRLSTGFTSNCDPGADNVIACPCGNQPVAPGRGCNNSSLTGGAALSASGIAYLSIDSLVFTTNDEKPVATSLLLQGDSWMSSGLVFGQGVRCVGGTLKRMFAKSAVSGSITAPDFNAGDPSVSARSASLGDPIQAGETRYYLVYYRDPIVLGGCPTTSTFNSTQTAAVSWWP